MLRVHLCMHLVATRSVVEFRAANIPVSRCATTTTWNYTKKVSSKMTL